MQKIVRKRSPSSTLTSKGQMTLPQAVRNRLNLKAGDKLDVVVEDQRIILVPATLHVDDLCNVLPRFKKLVSLDEMERVIRKRAIDRAR